MGVRDFGTRCRRARKNRRRLMRVGCVLLGVHGTPGLVMSLGQLYESRTGYGRGRNTYAEPWSLRDEVIHSFMIVVVMNGVELEE